MKRFLIALAALLLCAPAFAAGMSVTVPNTAVLQAFTARNADGTPISVGSTGTDASINKPTVPNVGSNFGGTGPYANWVYLGALAANPNRVKGVSVEDTTGVQIVYIVDDGVAAPGSTPQNASIGSLAPGAGAAQQGGSKDFPGELGRFQFYAAAALTGSQYLYVRQN